MRGRNLLLLAIVAVLVGAVGLFWVLRPGRGPEGELPELPVEELGTRSVTLYFGNRQGDGLVSERRTIRAQRHRDEEVELVVAELVRGPQAQKGVRTVPEGTRLLRAFYDEAEHLLYLDFNQALVAAAMGGSATEYLTLAALLRTIAVDFPEVERVQILVNGLEVETLGGHLDLTRPFRARDWL